MGPVAYILAGGLLTALVSLALGKLLLRGLRLELFRQEEYIFSFVSGAGLLSLIVFLLAAAHQARKGVFIGLGLVILAAAFWRGVHRSSRPSLPPVPLLWRALFWTVFAVFTVLYFFNAMAPEISPDANTYHLGLAAKYLREHGFRRFTNNMYGNLSQGAEMLFLYAFSIGRHSAAALTHFWFLVTLPLAILCYARRFGFPSAGAAAAVFAYCTPVVGIDGISAYNDVAVATVVFTLFYVLQVWDETGQRGLLILTGILAGFAYAIKYTAFLALPYAAGFVVWRLARRREPWLKAALAVCMAALVSIVPWMAKNALWLNNPFSPFLNKWFPNPFVHVSFEEIYGYHMRHYPGIESYTQLPLELTIRGNLLCGFLGPLFLLAPLAVLALRSQAGRRLLFAAALFGATYFANIGTRFLIPAVPFVALALALAVERMPAAMVTLALFHALSSWPDVARTYCGRYAWRLEKVRVTQALRWQPEEEFLAARVPGYLIARLVEEKVPPGKKVLTFTQIAEAHTNRSVSVCYQSAEGEELSQIIQMAIITDWQPASRLTFRFPARSMRRVRAIQTAGPDVDIWSIHELQVFHAGVELPRAPQWRLRARPYPWGVRNAFDNSPVTRWSSFQSQFPGMFVEVDFGREETVDTVVLKCSRDQARIRVKLEGIDAEPVDEDAPPLIGLRRAAIEELKLRGYDFLIINESDYLYRDIVRNSSVWGITMAGERNGYRLYNLD